MVRLRVVYSYWLDSCLRLWLLLSVYPGTFYKRLTYPFAFFRDAYSGRRFSGNVYPEPMIPGKFFPYQLILHVHFSAGRFFRGTFLPAFVCLPSLVIYGSKRLAAAVDSLQTCPKSHLELPQE